MTVYAVSGLTLASWGSRLPALKQSAALDGKQVGFVVAALATGTVLALIFAGQIVKRLHPALSVWLGAALCSAALVTAGLTHRGLMLGAAAVLLGIGNSIYDVAMNVQGAADGRDKRGRRLMPAFHGAWSVGALLGALGGAAAEHWHLSLGRHLTIVAGLTAVAAGMGSYRFDRLPEHPRGRVRTAGMMTRARTFGRGLLRPWTDLGTVALGLVAMGAAFAEGIANDWLSLALADRPGYDLEQEWAAGGLAVFSVGMIVLRFGYSWLWQRWPVRRVLVAEVLLVVLGTTLVLVGGLALDGRWPVLGVAVGITGLLVWGTGAALGVPLAMSEAAKAARARTRGASAPEHTTSERVGVVSTIGYAAFLGGPPLLGGLADDVGFLWILLVAPLVMVVAFGLAEVLLRRARRQAKPRSRVLARTVR